MHSSNRLLTASHICLTISLLGLGDGGGTFLYIHRSISWKHEIIHGICQEPKLKEWGFSTLVIDSIHISHSWPSNLSFNLRQITVNQFSWAERWYSRKENVLNESVPMKKRKKIQAKNRHHFFPFCEECSKSEEGGGGGTQPMLILDLILRRNNQTNKKASGQHLSVALHLGWKNKIRIHYCCNSGSNSRNSGGFSLSFWRKIKLSASQPSPLQQFPPPACCHGKPHRVCRQRGRQPPARTSELACE